MIEFNVFGWLGVADVGVYLIAAVVCGLRYARKAWIRVMIGQICVSSLTLLLSLSWYPKFSDTDARSSSVLSAILVCTTGGVVSWLLKHRKDY